MRILVTGGAGFIGRWVVKKFLDLGHQVDVLDDFSSGQPGNLQELMGHPGLKEIIYGDVRDEGVVHDAFSLGPTVCVHLAACINVQQSIDQPRPTVETDVLGSFNVLEQARRQGTRVIYVSTCMVYAPAATAGITENHPLRASSPYAAAKLAGEQLTLAYGSTYRLPVLVLRPFKTYGPFQRADGEGGVISIFLKRVMEGRPLVVFGNGTQTRDFLYVEDCARFIAQAALAEGLSGEIINAGSGADVRVLDLARQIAGGDNLVELGDHPHPQNEISRLICDYGKAQRLLEWQPQVGLAEGIRLTRVWMGGEQQ